jgi:hypothetical protein
MKLKKEYKTMKLFHPKKGEILLMSADEKTLNALSREKGYEHLFEHVKKQHNGNSKL